VSGTSVQPIPYMVGPEIASMPSGRVLAAYLYEARCELVRVFRSPAVVIFVLLFPVLFYLLVGVVFGLFRNPNPQVTRYTFIGFTVMATMVPGFSGFGSLLAIERGNGLHILRQALPMPALANLLGKTLMSVMCVALTVPALLVIGTLFGHLALTPMQMLSVWGLALVGSLPFCAIGLFIGTNVSERAATAVINLCFIPMLYLSGSFMPLPPSFAGIAKFTPPFYLQQIMLAALGEPHKYFGGSVAVHWLILAAVLALFTLLSVRRFRAYG
jgi:ABC-2 type transport system permease protein